MKTILNLITFSTLTAVIPTPLLSNISLIENVKQNVRVSSSNNEYVQLKKISGFGKAVQEVIVDSKDNIYFCIKTIFDYKNGIYKLSSGSTTPIKIDNSYDVLSFSIDNKDNLYFSKDNGLYNLSTGSDTSTPTKINGINESVSSISIDKFDNVYTGTNKGAYKLLVGSDTPIKINGVDSTEYPIALWITKIIYILKKPGLYTLKLFVVNQRTKSIQFN